MKHKIQIVGNFLEKIENPLYWLDIHIDSIISGVNPIAFCDERDDSLSYEPDKTDKPNVLLNIRKNFTNMLSRDVNAFESNVIVQPQSERVRDINRSDYILVYNNLFIYDMLRKNNVLYSHIKCKLCDELQHEACERITFPYPNNFDWRTNYYKFIDTIKSEYPADHIILLKSSVGPYVVECGLDIQRNTRWDAYAVFVKEADEIFAEETGCICINDLEASVVNGKTKASASFSVRSPQIWEQLAYTINNITEGTSFYNASNDILRNKELRSVYYPHIIGDIRKEFIDALQDKTSETFKKVSNDISELNEFFKNFNCFSITELYTFIVTHDDELLRIVEKYLNYFKCDINDILTIYKLYEDNDGLFDFTAIARNIVHSSDSTPIRKAIELYNKNIQKLKGYKYIHPDLLFDIVKKECIYLSLNNEFYLIIDLNAEKMFELRKITTTNAISFSDCKDNNCCIPVSVVNGILSDIRFYIERAKNGYGAEPIRVIFESSEQFCETLWTVDWSDILANELYVLTPDAKDVSIDEYKPICDLSFLFTGNVRLFMLRSGLADQMCYYLWSKYVEIHSKQKFETYYDDISVKAGKSMVPLDVGKVISEDIQPKLLYTKLSKKLSIKCKETALRFSDVLVINGCDEVNTIGMENVVAGTARNLIKYKMGEFKKSCNPKSKLPYYHMVARPDLLKSNLERFINIQSLDETNDKMIAEMSSVDSIVIHVRRGDFVTLGIGADMDFYKESMEKLAAIPDYHNKKFYVFSDDIPWCKTHTDEIGFDTYFPNADITYVTHNRQDDDYKDMVVMSYGKVIIGSNSGFVRMAAWMSKNCEVFMCYNLDTMKAFQKNVRKNKYRIGGYKKNYNTNWEGKRSSVQEKKK